MNISTAFPSKYLRAADLPEGAAPILTIDHVAIEEVGQDREARPVIYFTGKQKGMVCNKTNARAIAAIAGDDETDHWSGVQVQLYVAIVSYQGEDVEALRVRAPKRPAPPKPKPAPVADDGDVPF